MLLTVLREGESGDLAGVAGEVRHIALLFQIPDLDLRVRGSGAEDQTVRVELLKIKNYN